MDEHQETSPENGQHIKNVHLTRSWLESLSTDELIKLADSYGIDIPASLERVFIIWELLEADADNEHIPENNLEINKGTAVTALLPKQYNISYIEVIIRDPLWVFVFWEIKQHDRESYENSPGFTGYCLRVISLDAENPNNGKPHVSMHENMKENTDESFTVAINTDDTERYLGFPEDKTVSGVSTPVRCYIVKLCAIHDGREIPLAVSLPFVMNDGASKNIGNLQKNLCISLSGVQDFSVAKGRDHRLRAKRQ